MFGRPGLAADRVRQRGIGQQSEPQRFGAGLTATGHVELAQHS